MMAFLVLLAPPVMAQEKKAGTMDPQAIEVFQLMSEHLKQATTLSFTSSGMREVAEASGIKQLRGLSAAVALRRPEHVHAQALTDEGRATEIWFDGESLTVAASKGGETHYASIEAPEDAKTIDGMLDHLIEDYGFVLQLGDLLYDDVYATHEEALLSAVHLGRKLVGGRPCHHLSLEFAGADAQLWVQEGDDPIPCRWAFTLLDAPSEPLYVVNFESWVSNPDLAAERFAFSLPAGAVELEMEELLAEGGDR